MSELAERVTRLEQRMDDVHNLASGASAEVADIHVRLRAHTKSLEALRETQVEQGQEMREGFSKLKTEITNLDSEMREGFTKLGLGQAQITALLNIAISKADEK